VNLLIITSPPTSVFIMACLRKDRFLLEALIHATPKERKSLLKVCDISRIRSVCECAYNVLRGNVSLSEKSKKHLRTHKVTLRRLVKRGECWAKKRKFLVQKGGGVFIPILLSTVLQAALSRLTQ
jgi:hypothetical protein